MAVNRGTEAYDLSLFEPKPAKVVELKPNKKMQKATQRKNAIQTFINTVVTVGIAAVAVSVLGLMIASRVRMTELDSLINDKESQLVVLQSERVRLIDELSRKTSTENVEQYASDVLRMQKLESSQIEYISAESGDVVEMASADNQSVLEAVGEGVSNFFQQLVYLFE